MSWIYPDCDDRKNYKPWTPYDRDAVGGIDESVMERYRKTLTEVISVRNPHSSQTDDIIKVETPGYSKERLRIFQKGSTLYVVASEKPSKESPNGFLLFELKFIIGNSVVQKDGIKYENGLLTIPLNGIKDPEVVVYPIP